jgi:hypothetical protein
MKIFYTFVFLISFFVCQGQISVLSTADGFVVITPKGLSGKTNSTTVSSNVALGNSALSNTSGEQNTATGEEALKNNSTGSYNTASGYSALMNNSTGFFNTAVGVSSLYKNSTGSYNTSVGIGAMEQNTIGGFNTATGFNALRYNNQGVINTAIGASSLINTTTGDYNTALGGSAGGYNSTGNYNTFVGYNSNATATDFSNATAIGHGAIVNASNKVRIGDSLVTVIEGQVAWTSVSDRRLKENIVYTSRLGLNFIRNLQTVSYNFIADKNKTRYDGFIAQDIEAVMKELNLPFSGLKKSEDGRYSLSYSDFVMPLVNAVIEQQEKIEKLEKELNHMKELEKKIELMATRLGDKD